MNSKYTSVKPYNKDEGKTEQLSRMFNTISHQYDRFNDIMSWGMAHVWRKNALKRLAQFRPKRLLDIATGTGDICIHAFDFFEPEEVVGVDISDRMMHIGQEKVKKAKLDDKIRFEVQDCAQLNFSDNSFDAVTISFGIRNFEKLDESIDQIRRVLRNDGKLMILEMNEPNKGFLYLGYKIYTRFFVKATSKYFSNDRSAYDYLTASMHAFANGPDLIRILESHGFKLLTFRKFTLGVCSVYLLDANK